MHRNNPIARRPPSRNEGLKIMRANKISRNLGANKVIPVSAILLCGLILASGRPLRAQESVDLPSKPEPTTTTTQQDSSTSDPSTNSASVDAPVIPAQPLTFGERLKIYERSFIRPDSLIGPAFGAGIGQWRDTPREWGQGADAYGVRFASGLGRSIISRTIEFGFAATDHEDTRFFPSNETGVWRRTRHAIAGTFVSRTPSGGSMPAFSRFAGAYGAGFIANAWEPRSQNDAGHALERGSTALLSSVGWHIFEEFWPDIRGAFHHH
jgi:hypothetical protein